MAGDSVAPDAFGQAFLDYYHGKKPEMKIRRDDGYEDVDNLEQYFERYEGWPECERLALKHAKRRVLDIGTGAGRVAIYLQEKGHEVTGIDISWLALEIARRRGLKNFSMASACDLKFEPGSFDTAITFGNNFGLCGTPEGVVGMLVRLRKVVSDGGNLLAESIDPTNTAEPRHIEYHRQNKARGRLPGQVTISFMYKGLSSMWMELLLVTPEEMKTLAEKAGWKVTELYNPVSSAPFYAAVLEKA